MAAPHVAGAAALLLEEDPTLVAGEGVRAVLQARASAGVISGTLEGDPNLLLNVGMAGGPTTPFPTWAPVPTPPPGTWVVKGTGCAIEGNCIASSNHPSHYGNDEACTIELGGDVGLTFPAFETESGYDFLTVGGVQYTGTTGPPNGVYSGVIEWASDHIFTSTGWMLCTG